jgi:hypothetical protein
MYLKPFWPSLALIIALVLPSCGWFSAPTANAPERMDPPVSWRGATISGVSPSEARVWIDRGCRIPIPEWTPGDCGTWGGYNIVIHNEPVLGKYGGYVKGRQIDLAYVSGPNCGSDAGRCLAQFACWEFANIRAGHEPGSSSCGNTAIPVL